MEERKGKEGERVGSALLLGEMVLRTGRSLFSDRSSLGSFPSLLPCVLVARRAEKRKRKKRRADVFLDDARTVGGG